MFYNYCLQWEPVSEELHSTSVLDVFSAASSLIDIFKKFNKFDNTLIKAKPNQVNVILNEKKENETKVISHTIVMVFSIFVTFKGFM